MDTLKQQIENKCIHFNGLQNKRCKKDILYDNIKDDSRPVKIPCFKNNSMSGGVCSCSEFPTNQEVQNRINEIQTGSVRMFKVYGAIKEHYNESKVRHGIIECPECKGELQYSIAEVNDHIHAKCQNCDVSFME